MQPRLSKSGFAKLFCDRRGRGTHPRIQSIPLINRCNQFPSRRPRKFTGYRAAVEALVPAPDHWRARRAGAPGYWDNTPKTVAEATECNQDALRWHGIPEGAWPTSADGRFGLWGGRDFRESDSEPDESDSDDSE